jgi:hypothetical protein
MNIREPTSDLLEKAFIQEVDVLQGENKPLNFSNIGLLNTEITDIS